MDGSSESIQVLIWMLLGLTLLSSEAFTGNFNLLFVGLAALLVASLAALGLHQWWLQISIFSFVSLGSSFLGHLRMRRQTHEEFETGPHIVLRLKTSLAPGESREIEFRGARWMATNRSSRTLEVNEEVVVMATEGVTLILQEKSSTQS